MAGQAPYSPPECTSTSNVGRGSRDCEIDYYHQNFLKEESRLFSTKTDEVETLYLPSGASESAGLQQRIGKWDQDNANDGGFFLHVIRQEYSWGRLLISPSSLQSLISHHHIFPQFYALIGGFGFKTSEDDKVWDGYHSNARTVRSSENMNVEFECCYSIRYVHLNGRNSKNPWSLRQIGVYHKAKNAGKDSVWILVQPPGTLYKQWKSKMEFTPPDEASFKGRDVDLHLSILSVTLNNWDHHIEYLRNELSELEDKACFSRVGMEKPHDYSVAFSDKQKLQRFREKLLRYEGVLKATVTVIESLKSHFRHFSGSLSVDEQDLNLMEFDNFSRTCKRHQQSIAILLQRMVGIDQLLSKILELRNDYAVVQLNQAMQNSLCMLNQISAQNADVAEQGRMEANTLTLLTIIATMYLPASLLATLFSSNLIQLVEDGNPSAQSGPTHFRLASQFWMYALLTAVMTMMTLLPTFLVSKLKKFKSNFTA
ncbi:hypothetical protein, variant [Verruconis gallopava]|uniref:CorA-like transporter domain-containing protein n=1 Tax=Verruconis gallopava TaxID=253628 RepID=A0A0D2A071_9PEZI|nr:hypothetical protein, variant [Verruconis gallopava]KIV99997.1 hypothetical protein, variant [Verruconis gallopava]